MPRIVPHTAPLLAAILVPLMAAAPAHPQALRAPVPEDEAFLAAHNRARAEAGAPPLVWSEGLARDAAVWAAHLAATGLYEHADLEQRRGQGENLWRGSRGYWGATAKIGFFVAEKAYFRPGQFPEVSSTGRWSDVGHYTQVIWPQTRAVGCAVAETPSEEVLVCRYWPAGNIWGYPIDPRAQLARR